MRNLTIMLRKISEVILYISTHSRLPDNALLPQSRCAAILLLGFGGVWYAIHITSEDTETTSEPIALPIKTLNGHSNLVTSVAISPDGRTLASGSADQTIKIWLVSP